MDGGEVYVHTTSARGHFRANVEREPRVCFAIDEPDDVFDYGRFECDSGLAYRSVILFGKIRIAEDKAVKQRFCEALMVKYGKADTTRPKGFFPRIDMITVYAISVERMTGKEMALPPLSSSGPQKTGPKRRTHGLRVQKRNLFARPPRKISGSLPVISERASRAAVTASAG
jgi:uncharacterized protein